MQSYIRQQMYRIKSADCQKKRAALEEFFRVCFMLTMYFIDFYFLFHFLALDVIYTSRAYATSVRLSVTEVHRCIIANLGFKLRSQFTAHCGRSACGHEEREHRREECRDHLALC